MARDDGHKATRDCGHSPHWAKGYIQGALRFYGNTAKSSELEVDAVAGEPALIVTIKGNCPKRFYVTIDELDMCSRCQERATPPDEDLCVRCRNEVKVAEL